MENNQPPATRPGLVGARALVVEDDYLIADYIREALTEAGAAEVLIASTPAEAEAHLAAGDVDFAIVDINLGAHSGREVALRLIERGILFVFSTGYGSDTRLAGEFAAVPALAKPFTADILIRAVAALLAGRDSHT